MPGAPISIFISYSRTDSPFVDRLEADLKVRNFRPWVDRRKIEGGQDWMDVLQQAIDSCQILLLVLSPEAMESKYVRREYRYADQQGKLIIPLNLRTTKVPIGLNDIQWINFQSDYGQGLNELLTALSRQELVASLYASHQPSTSFPIIEPDPVLVMPRPAPAPPDADLNELYRAGVAARAEGNLERTAIFWKQVLDRDTSFGNGTLTQQMLRLQAELRPLRVQRLREQAEQAHRAGVWGQEIGAWQALLGLEPSDSQAKSRITVAQQNQQFAWVYENAQEFAKAKNIPALKEQLGLLWHDAPYYGDPAGLAKLAGLKVPPGFQESMNTQLRAQNTAAEAKRKADKALKQKYMRKAFVESTLEMSDWVFWLLPFCLLGGIGTNVGVLSQSWIWAVGVIIVLALLAYSLGYRQGIGVIQASIILLVSGAVAFSFSWFLSTFQYDQPQMSHLWLGIRTITLRHQLIFGVILGAVGGFMEGSCIMISIEEDDLSIIFIGIFWIIVGLLVLWSMIALLGSFFDWGFGYGYGWNFTLLVGIPMALIGGLSLIPSFIVWNKALYPNLRDQLSQEEYAEKLLHEL